MAIEHGAEMRSDQALSLITRTDQGSTFGKIVILTAADAVLATITLQKPSFSQAAAVDTLLGVPISTTASGTGTAAKCEVRDSDDNVSYEGTCGTSGTDFIIDNTSITSGQTVRITACTYTAAL